MLLVMDVGNTNIVIGIFKEDQLIHQWRMATDRHKTEDELGMHLKMFFDSVGIGFHQIDGLMISSVVPPLRFALEQLGKKYFRHSPLFVGQGVDIGLTIRQDHPQEVGADRIVNAVAAIKEYGPPLIIVDFGTATTFCLVNDEGIYLGGAITPGIHISMEALYQNASKLPKIEFAKPASVVGRNTVMAMQSGVYYGYVGLVDGIVNRLKKEVKKDPKVIATGGLAELIRSDSETIDVVDSTLTLKGLKIIYDRNRSLSGKI
ncbi:pantothenate kinase [[Clostridium] ultunense Esp]|nr:pantothenate kinase [[Clostridium] ultunense Esp]